MPSLIELLYIRRSFRSFVNFFLLISIWPAYWCCWSWIPEIVLFPIFIRSLSFTLFWSFRTFRNKALVVYALCLCTFINYWGFFSLLWCCSDLIGYIISILLRFLLFCLRGISFFSCVSVFFYFINMLEGIVFLIIRWARYRGWLARKVLYFYECLIISNFMFIRNEFNFLI